MAYWCSVIYYSDEMMRKTENDILTVPNGWLRPDQFFSVMKMHSIYCSILFSCLLLAFMSREPLVILHSLYWWFRIQICLSTFCEKHSRWATTQPVLQPSDSDPRQEVKYYSDSFHHGCLSHNLHQSRIEGKFSCIHSSINFNFKYLLINMLRQWLPKYFSFA